jgi:hypothetical protein
MLNFKEGVRLQGLKPQMLIALQVVEEELGKMGVDTWITSANDSDHKKGSKHYEGSALDFRTRHIGGLGKSLATSVAKRIAHLGFDVLYEAGGTPNEHLHVEYDPK